MRASKSIFQLIFLILNFNSISSAWSASALKLDSSGISIQGVTKSSVQVSAIAYYVQAYQDVLGKPSSECTFPEDAGRAQRSDQVVVINTQTTGSDSYLIQIPKGGQRGQCKYVLDTVYMLIEGAGIYSSFHVRSSEAVSYMNRLLSDLGGYSVASFSGLSSVECSPLVGYESTILCYGPDKQLLTSAYGFSPGVLQYRLDVR